MIRKLRQSSFRQYPLGGAVFRVACTSARLIDCSHKCIVNIMKVYIERNSIQVELIRFRKNSDFIIDFGNFEVGIYFGDRRSHCCTLRVVTDLFRGHRARRTFRGMTTSVHTISGHFQFGTYTVVTSGHVISGQARFGTTQQHYFKLLYMYRQFTRSKRQFGSSSLLFTPFMTV